MAMERVVELLKVPGISAYGCRLLCMEPMTILMIIGMPTDDHVDDRGVADDRQVSDRLIVRMIMM